MDTWLADGSVNEEDNDHDHQGIGMSSTAMTEGDIIRSIAKNNK